MARIVVGQCRKGWIKNQSHAPTRALYWSLVCQHNSRNLATFLRMHMNPPKLSMFQVLACGAAIVTLSMGVRHGFGLWLQPITQEMGWTRQSFAFAIALQNLSWGVIGIFAGMAADRFGAFRVLMGGAVLYGLGLAGMALSPTPLFFALTTGLLIGAAQAGTTYAVIYGVLGRQIAPVSRAFRGPPHRSVTRPSATPCGRPSATPASIC